MESPEPPQYEKRPLGAQRVIQRTGNVRLSRDPSPKGWLGDRQWSETEGTYGPARRTDIAADTIRLPKAVLAGGKNDVGDFLQPSTAAVRAQPVDVVSLLPKIRRSARLLMKNADAADKLVELTLERATAAVKTRDDPVDLDAWLGLLLEDTFKRIGTDLRRLYT